MRLLSWIFQPAYLIFFVIIAALYIYREEVIPEHRDIEQSKTLVAQIEKTIAVIEEEGRSVRSLPSNQILIPEEDAFNPSSKLEAEVNPQEPAVVATTDTLAADDVSDTEVTSEGNSSVTSENLFESFEATDEIESTQAATLVETVKQASLGTLWYAARRAARGDDSEQAIERYLQLTSNYPDNADGFGELGNLYYAMGDKEAALGAYQQALKIYQTAGYSGQSLQLQKVINEIR